MSALLSLVEAFGVVFVLSAGVVLPLLLLLASVLQPSPDPRTLEQRAGAPVPVVPRLGETGIRLRPSERPLQSARSHRGVYRFWGR